MQKDLSELTFEQQKIFAQALVVVVSKTGYKTYEIVRGDWAYLESPDEEFQLALSQPSQKTISRTTTLREFLEGWENKGNDVTFDPDEKDTDFIRAVWEQYEKYTTALT